MSKIKEIRVLFKYITTKKRFWFANKEAWLQHDIIESRHTQEEYIISKNISVA